MTPKVAFQVSQFSGPLSYGAFPMVSSLPPFRAPSPAVKQVGGGVGSNLPDPTSMSPRVKEAEVAYAPTVPIEKLRALAAAKRTLEKISAQGYGTTITAVSSPAAVLRRVQAVGQGKISPAPGPSIGMQVKPQDFGKGSATGPTIPGAGKSTLGV